MKTEVTRTVVTLVEVHTRETGDATVKGVSKVSDDSTLSRKVWINGEVPEWDKVKFIDE